jgi:DNA-binding NtrC family response regulator
MQDVEALAEHFLHRYAAQESKNITGFADDARDWMKRHEWPGNARELENRIYRAALLCEGSQISLRDLSPPLQKGVSAPRPQTKAIDGDTSIDLTTTEGEFKTMAALREEIEQAALRLCNGNVVLAAQRLGVGKSTLYRHRGK